ncbi:hypothetical protein M569_05233, partial [Genlisea aurea]
LFRIRRRNVFVYNSLISGFPNYAVYYYVRLRQEGVLPNKHTFPSLLKSRAPSSAALPFQIFSQAIKFGFGNDRFFCNSLISSLANGGLADSARQVFDEMSARDLVSYTALMDGFVRNSRHLEALELFIRIKGSGLPMDGAAVVSGLCAAGASGHLFFGRWIHGFYVISGRVFSGDVYIGSGLVDMYSKCGYCEDALRAFQDMPFKNVVSWSVLLSGHLQCHSFMQVLHLFSKMLSDNAKPNETVLTSVLTACAQLGALVQGMWIHSYICLNKLQINSILGTALIDMYSKCGYITGAEYIFNSMLKKDVYPWTAFISGLAMNGDANGSLNLFRRMLRCGVRPNEVTFVAVLSGCSHGGLINEGRELFRGMEADHGIKPTIDHYGCMVDLLGRAGKLREAVTLIQQMPMEVSESITNSLLSSCINQRGDHQCNNNGVEMELGKRIGIPADGGGAAYVLLANLYSKCGKWEAAGDVRRMMKEGRVGKNPGCSWIETNGVVREFSSFDNSSRELQNV